MRVVRILLQLICGLVCTLLIAMLVWAPRAEYAEILPVMAISIFFMMILGPWWPNEQNVQRIANKSKFQLPTDNFDVARYVANFLGAAYLMYEAWDRYHYPAKELWRFEKIGAAIAGTNGAIGIWLVLACLCLADGIRTYIKSKKT